MRITVKCTIFVGDEPASFDRRKHNQGADIKKHGLAKDKIHRNEANPMQTNGTTNTYTPCSKKHVTKFSTITLTISVRLQ